MRKLGLAVLIIVALPAVPARAADLEAFEATIAFLSQSLNKLSDFAAELRGMGGAAKEQALTRARSGLVALDEPFAAARQQAAALGRDERIEKWRERADRAGDLVEAYKKEQELQRLEMEFAELKDELCGPRDLYRFDGSCMSPAPVRPYGESITR